MWIYCFINLEQLIRVSDETRTLVIRDTRPEDTAGVFLNGRFSNCGEIAQFKTDSLGKLWWLFVVFLLCTPRTAAGCVIPPQNCGQGTHLSPVGGGAIQPRETIEIYLQVQTHEGNFSQSCAERHTKASPRQVSLLMCVLVFVCKTMRVYRQC